MVLVTLVAYSILLFLFLSPIIPIVINYNIGNNSIAIQPELKRDQNNHTDADGAEYHDSWIDVEPNTGLVLGTTQKYLVSVKLDKDELFDVDQFVPVYYVFRSGNYTEQAVIFIFI
jgi:hypothetical protein